MNDIKKLLGKRIKELRKAQGISQQQLAELLRPVEFELLKFRLSPAKLLLHLNRHAEAVHRLGHPEIRHCAPLFPAVLRFTRTSALQRRRPVRSSSRCRPCRDRCR